MEDRRKTTKRTVACWPLVGLVFMAGEMGAVGGFEQEM